VTGSLTALAMLNTTICTSSRAIQSMAALGFFPKPLARLSPRFKTPIAAILCNGTLVFLLLLPDLNFSQVANVSMFFYALTIFILVSAFLRLRRSHAHLARPFRVPLDGWKLVAVVALPPCGCCVVLLAFSTPLTWLVAMTVVLCTGILWGPVNRRRNARLGIHRDPCRTEALPDPPMLFTGHGDVELRGPFANV
jgi:amino acid transporter